MVVLKYDGAVPSSGTMVPVSYAVIISDVSDRYPYDDKNSIG